jgi:hypothetical protein
MSRVSEQKVKRASCMHSKIQQLQTGTYIAFIHTLSIYIYIDPKLKSKYCKRVGLYPTTVGIGLGLCEQVVVHALSPLLWCALALCFINNRSCTMSMCIFSR